MGELRFLIDEAGFQEPIADVPATLELLQSRIMACRRGGVAKFSLIWEELVNGHPLADWLFKKEHGLDPVLARALQILLDRSPNWDEVLDCDGLSPDVTVDGVKRVAYSVAAAASFTSRSTATACVSPSAPLGTRAVSLPASAGNEQTVTIRFVGDHGSVLLFFRELPEVEDLDENGYFVNAARAFPDIHFHRDRLRFSAFDEEYRTIRKKVSHHLAVLNDHGRNIFKTRSEPKDIQAELGSHGVEASGESGNTKADAQAMRQRKVVIEGQEVVLEWHTKLRPHLDRIYFSATARQQLVVGVFHKHLD